ncbi:sensor histidine kinase [Floccifex sp.]|uniref:sensor histidine kinase n=1 Tax=Floccifex sp. TaxID=2815810 RepID=UPI003F127C9C
MKKKNIFTILFYFILVAVSILSIIFYPSIKDLANSKKNRNFGYQFQEDLIYFIVQEAINLDENYQPLTFPENINKDLKNEIEERFYTEVNNYYLYNKNDSSFYYSFKNIKTNQEESNLKENFTNKKENLNLYLTYTKKENQWELNSNYHESMEALFKDIFNQFLDNNLYDIEDIWMEDDGETIHYQTDEYTYSYNTLCTLNVPENIEIHIEVPLKIDSTSVFSNYDLYYKQEIYMQCFAILYSIVFIILLIYILLVPIKYLKEIIPFKWIQNIHFEFLFIILCISIPCMIAANLYVAFFTASGTIVSQLKQINQINLEPLLYLGNICMYFISYLLIAIAIFICKQIIIHPIQYLKEKCLITKLYYWIKGKILNLSRMDLSSSYVLPISILCLINLILMCIFGLLEGFGFVLGCIYSLILFYFAMKKIDEIRVDYKALLDATNQLKEGNFNNKMDQDVHLFNSLKDSINEVYDGFELAVKEEAKSQNMKVELISNVSHDLKTPLTCIKNYVLLLQDVNIKEETRKEYLDNLNKYCDRLNVLMQDLLQISKINSGNIELEIHQLNIISLLNQVIFENEEALEEKHLVIKKNFEDDEILLNLDSNKTYRIFENLLTNIAKYSLSFSRVYLDVFENEETVQVIFKNISQDEMNFTPEEIEERFVRGDKSRHETGSGLGLAIVKSFTEIQGGIFTIEIEGDLFKTIVTFKK